MSEYHLELFHLSVEKQREKLKSLIDNPNFLVEKDFIQNVKILKKLRIRTKKLGNIWWEIMKIIDEILLNSNYENDLITLKITKIKSDLY